MYRLTLSVTQISKKVSIKLEENSITLYVNIQFKLKNKT